MDNRLVRDITAVLAGGGGGNPRRAQATAKPITQVPGLPTLREPPMKTAIATSPRSRPRRTSMDGNFRSIHTWQ